MKLSFRLPVSFLLLLVHLLSAAQIITSDPDLPTPGQAVTIYYDATMDVRIIGNFDVETLSINPSFSKTGRWYDYFAGDSIEVSDLQELISLEPGEYRLYTSLRLRKPDITAGIGSHTMRESQFRVFPNPVSGTLYLEPIPESAILNILNSAGQLLISLEMEMNQDYVDLSSLPTGLYILSRRTETMGSQYVKVIVE